MTEEVDPVNEPKRLTVEVSSGDRQTVEIEGGLWLKLKKEAEKNGRGIEEEMQKAVKQVLDEWDTWLSPRKT